MDKVYVFKQHAVVQGDRGFVVPVAKVLTDGNVVPVHQDDFPNNGRIHISKGYLSDVDEKFEDGEIFQLNEYYEDENKLWLSDPRSEKFWSLGHRAQPIIENILSPIIEAVLPNPIHPIIEGAPESAELKRHILIRDNDYIYGPFIARPDGQRIILEPAHLMFLPIPQYHVYKFPVDVVDPFIIHTEDIGTHFGQYLSSIEVLKRLDGETYDYIPDDALIRFANKTLLAKSPKRLTKGRGKN